MLKMCIILFCLGSLQCFSQAVYWEHYIDQSNFNKNTISTEAYNVENKYYLIEILSPYKLNELKKNNIDIVHILDDKHCIVYATYNELKQLAYLKFYLANTNWKFIGLLKGAKSIKSNTKHTYTIKVTDIKKITYTLKQHNIKIKASLKNYIQVYTTQKNISELILPLTYVLYVSTESFSPIQETLITDYNHNANSITNVTQKHPELDGTGFSVGIKDNKPFFDDLDVGNKVISSILTATTEDLHATIMASIIAGKGINGPQALGIVPKATIFSTSFKNLVPDPIETLKQQKVYTQNHSYGTKIENFYGLLAAEYDTTIYKNTELVHIFSSGNNGTANNGISNLTGNFKAAKNNIVVGAVNNTNQVLSKSSKGPTFDGRIKPEIVAYSSVGTSNAAALVSGITLQLQQYYFLKENKMPPNYLIKALLLNGADDIGAPGVDFKAGFGSVNALQSLQMLKNNQFFLNEITSNETSTISINIPENVAQLKIMLVWNDIPANPNDTTPLKNDLDLKAINNNQIILPHTLIATTPSNKYELLNAEDHLNPVEQITILDDIKNTYDIQVKATTLSTNSQKYALVYSYKLKDTFEWVFPNTNTTVNPTDINTHFLRWNSTFDKETTGSIEIDYNNTNNWTPIAENITLATFFYQWEPPKITTKNARLKLTLTNNEETVFITPTFEIAPTTAINLGFNCDQNLELHWQKNKAIDFYEVYGINTTNDTSEFILKTSDTTAIINKRTNSQLLYLLPHLNENEKITRTNTINTTNFEEKCYFENLLFLADAQKNKGTISLQLNSLFEIEQIQLFKNAAQPELIENRTSITELLQNYEITNLDNTTDFFFELRLKNGLRINSEILKHTTETEVPLSIYPNPVNNQMDLTISSSTLNLFYLYDMQGKLMLQKKLLFEINTFPLSISPGTYILILEDVSKNKTTRKLIVN